MIARQLVEDSRFGRMVMPELQWDYVWRKSKSPKFIDSMCWGFPISSLLLWQSTDATRAPIRSSLMNWLIDAQQRVITLSRTINRDEGIEVVFHPDEESFCLSNAATRQDPTGSTHQNFWTMSCTGREDAILTEHGKQISERRISRHYGGSWIRRFPWSV